MKVPSCDIRRGDWKKVLEGVKPNHIITDPPYEDLPEIAELRELCPGGNIIMFSRPGDEPRGADEYLFWVKPTSTKNYSRRCGRFVEVISVFRTDGAAFSSLHWSQMTGVYGDRLVLKTVHPFQKPLSLMERLIRIYTRPGELICDPYAGSGTTGVAALRLGRSFVGSELQAEHCKTARRRLKDVG